MKNNDDKACFTRAEVRELLKLQIATVACSVSRLPRSADEAAMMKKIRTCKLIDIPKK